VPIAIIDFSTAYPSCRNGAALLTEVLSRTEPEAAHSYSYQIIVLVTLDSRWYEQNNMLIQDYSQFCDLIVIFFGQYKMNGKRNPDELCVWHCFQSWLHLASMLVHSIAACKRHWI
jgi:hypothetical protein